MKIQDDWWQEGYEAGKSDKFSEILKLFKDHNTKYSRWAYDFLLSEGEEWQSEKS